MDDIMAEQQHIDDVDNDLDDNSTMNDEEIIDQHHHHPFDEDGDLVQALKEAASLDAIRRIIHERHNGAPEEALRQRRVKDKLTPLHRAIRSKSSPEVIHYFVTAWPGSILERTYDDNADLPLHLACRQRRRTDEDEADDNDDSREWMATVVSILVRAWPDSVRQTNAHSDLPLHLASDPSTIRYLVHQYPAALTHSNLFGCTPLHLAVSEGRSIHAVHELLQLGGLSAVQVKDRAGRIPLHHMSNKTPYDVIQLLISQWHESLQEPDPEGYLALHRACTFPGNEQGARTVRYILQRFPRAVRAVTKDGRTPLEIALRSKACVDAIRALVGAWPESAQQTWSASSSICQGLYPLHVAASMGNLDNVRVLYDAWPEAIRAIADGGTEWEKGGLPLHMVARSSCRLSEEGLVKVAKFLVEQYPESVHVRSPEGLLPLHEAARRQNAAVAHFLIKRWPESVRFTTPAGLLPIHEAAQGNNVELAQMLFERWPESLQQKCHEGNLPAHVAAMRGSHDMAIYLYKMWRPAARDTSHRVLLHEAIRRGCSDFVRLIEADWPGAIRATCRNGLLSIHVAARAGNAELSDFFLQRWPESTRERSRDGRVPLHEAVRGGNLTIVQSIHRKWTGAVRVASASGHLPLHDAVQYGNWDMTRFLVNEWPESVRVAAVDGRLPLHLASLRGDPTLARFLVEAWPESVRIQAADLRLPLHDACNSTSTITITDDSSASDTKTKQMALVRSLVERHPPSVQVRDIHGNLPLHLASAAPGALSSIQLVKYLSDQLEESVQVRNRNGMIPFSIAATNDASLDVLFCLARKWPESILGLHHPRAEPQAAHDASGSQVSGD